MTLIETENFELTSAEYFKIILKLRIKRSWWLFLIITFAPLAQFLWQNGIPINWGLIIFGWTYPILVIIYLYFWATSKKNASLFQKRRITFEGEKMTIEIEDGSKSEVRYTSIQNVRTFGDSWLLYVARNQWIYVTKSAFKSDQDQQEFVNLIKLYANL